MPSADGDPATVVVTGMGAVSALGTGCAAHLAALRAGRDGLRPVTRFDARPFGSAIAGTWPAWDDRVQPEAAGALTLRETAAAFSVVEMALVAPALPHRRGLRHQVVQDRRAHALDRCLGAGQTLLAHGAGHAVDHARALGFGQHRATGGAHGARTLEAIVAHAG